MIPTNDVLAGYNAQSAEIDAAALRVLRSGWYILGQEVEAFEREFAAWLGSSSAVGVANGTDAIMLALRALGVRPGEGVLTVSHTAVATVAGIEMAGAIPLLVDIEPETCTMCPASLIRAIAAAESQGIVCRAVMPVHLYGHPCDMDAICGVVREHGLLLIEDCSQSHGAQFRGRMTGTFGDAAAFSLYPTKNLGALGDAGVVTFAEQSAAERTKMLRQYGWQERNRSQFAGVNSRLDELQAAVLRVRLKGLDAANDRRRAIASIYQQGLLGLPLHLPVSRLDCRHVYHQFVIQTPDRSRLQAKLRDAGIATMVHYPHPVHLQPAYAMRLPRVVEMTNTERVVPLVLSLPMFPEMTELQASAVVRAIVTAVGVA